MSQQVSYDAVVVGSGPNGLAAGIRLAQEGFAVLLVEANDSLGGGTRSAELTLPGFVHDVCSAIHPLGLGSPFFRQLPLEKHGLHWIQPEFALAHPMEDGTAAALQRSPDSMAQRFHGSCRRRREEADCSRTPKGFPPSSRRRLQGLDFSQGLGKDQAAYERLMAPLVDNWESLTAESLQPLLHLPRHPLQLALFGLRALRSADGLARGWFEEAPARALFAGLAAHSFLPLEQKPSAAVGLVLGMLGHAVGWPLPRGGSQQIANALAAHLRSLGGEIATNTRVESLDQLPLARAVLFDLTPRQLLRIAGDRLPASYRQRLDRYRYGPGVFKIDYALRCPIPWKAKVCSRAGTVHVGGQLEEVGASERVVAEGQPAERPFVLVAQPSLFDNTRAPEGKHTAWVYCHVPNGSLFDMTERIETQIERFAPGFRDCVLARHTMNCADLERRNANFVGGDINGGAADLRQLFARPIFTPTPYRIPVPGFYLCSASTPPGGGVHGMCGFHAAEAAIRHTLKR